MGRIQRCESQTLVKVARLIDPDNRDRQFGRNPEMGIVIEVLRPVAWVLCRLLFRIRFEGVENVPLTGGCLITPNHISYADPIWLTIPIRRRVYYMAWDK